MSEKSDFLVILGAQSKLLRSRININNMFSKKLRMNNSIFKLEEIRISYVFSITNPISDDLGLEHRLISKKYKINSERIITRPPLQAVILNLARKNNVHILYEKEKIPSFIGTSGNKKNVIVDAFEELTGLLKDMDEMIVKQKKHIEAVMTYNIMHDQINPKQHLFNFAKSQVNKISDTGDYNMENFTLKSKKNGDDVSIHIAPLYRDTRYFYVQSLMWSNNIENIFKFVDEQETHITQILSKLDNE